LLRPSATELYLQPFIIEICAIKFNDVFEVVDKFTTFVKPPVPIPDEVIDITKITNEMAKDAPPFALVYDDLCDFFLGETDMYAHNCSFDATMILNELRRMGMETKFPWPKNQICTVEKSYPIMNKRLNLRKLYEIATGEAEFPNAHRAESDVMAMIECIKWMKENQFL
jgi:DNA polymerase III epsilon subunit-like protein